MDNLAENLSTIRQGLDARDLPKRNDPCIIVGAGPSLSVYKHLNVLKRSGWSHTILSCDKVLGDCVRRGIIPYAVATVDGSPKINGFYNRHDVKKHTSTVNGLFNVLVHPSVVKTWQENNGKIYWFVSAFDEPDPETNKLDIRSLTHIMYLLSKEKGMISGMGNVGAFLWNVAYALECDPIILIGIDFSEQVRDKSDAVYFDYYTKFFLKKYSPAVAQDKAADMHQPEVNPDFTAPFTRFPYYKKCEPVHYLVNPVWKYYRDNLAMHIVSSKKHTINCTGNGSLHTEAKNDKGDYILKCPNFEARPFEEVLKKYA